MYDDSKTKAQLIEELGQLRRKVAQSEALSGLDAQQTINTRVSDLDREMEESLSLTDLLDSDMLQEIQDAFASATGVASIITEPDGTPITKPSNFCRLCIDIIRNTEKGLANCMSSDAVIGRQNLSGPIMQPCLSGGLWDGGASISVSGRHIGNWLIGQVRDDSFNQTEMMAYAREIGADEEEFRAALDEVRVMPKEQFAQVCQALFLIANQLSQLAMQNLQQAEHIAELKRAEHALMEAEARFRDVAFSSADWIWEVDHNGTYTFASGRVKEILGLAPEEIIGKTPFDLMPPGEADRVGKIFQEIAAGKKPIVDLENWNLTREGKKICLLTNGVPILDEKGELIGYRGVDKDITDRKLAEEALREKEYIIESASSVIATSDIEGIMSYVNPAFLKTWGFAHAAEVLGNHFSEYWMVDQRHDEFLRVLQDKGDWAGEVKARKKDGTLFNVQVYASVVFDKEGNPISLMSSSIDITARLQAEEALKESEEKYRNLVELANDGIMILQDDVLKYVNPQLAQMAGYTVDELMEIPARDYLHPSESDEVMGRYERRMAGEDVEPVYHTAIRHKDGRRIEVEVHAGIVSYQGRAADMVLVRDATERKQAEEALRESEEKYRNLVEMAKDGITIVQDRVVKYINPQLAQMAGYTIEELTGKPISEIIHPSEAARGMDRYQRRMAGEDVEPIYYSAIRHKDGRRIEVEIHASIISFHGRAADMALVRDATQRKREEEERIEREKLHSVIETAGAVCHQLNQPLQVIMASIELLSMNLDDPEIKTRFDVILREAERMGQITNNLERITKYETEEYLEGVKILDIKKSSE